MKLQFATQTTMPQGGLRINGLGCPQCSAPLVDSIMAVNSNARFRECNCTLCDYVSTYNKETLELTKKY